MIVLPPIHPMLALALWVLGACAALVFIHGATRKEDPE